MRLFICAIEMTNYILINDNKTDDDKNGKIKNI